MIKFNFIKNFFLTILIIVFLINYAQAKCNFGIKIGDNVTKLKKELINIDNDDSVLVNIYASALNICPNENFDKNININFTFIENELASIRVIVNNGKDNITSNKLLLMNYAKENYGDFKTGQNPKAYNYFNVWKNIDEIIVYKRIINKFKIIEEEIFITNKTYNQKIKKINQEIELGRIRN